MFPSINPKGNSFFNSYFELIDLDDDKKQTIFKKINDRNRIYYEVLARAVDNYGTDLSIDTFKFFSLM